MCRVILYPLVESSLPINVLRSFERQRKSLENELKLSSLDAIIHFLKNEVETEEKIRLSRTDIFHFSSERKNAAPANSRDRKPSATELFIGHKSNDNLCMFCSKNHETRSCKKAYFIPLDEKLSVIKRKGLCRICLTKGHLAKLCSSSIKCNLCSERHLKLMCPNLEVNKLDQIPKQSLIWNKDSDTLKIDSESLKLEEPGTLTKRKILSLTSRIFDPIGFISPALIRPKLLLQETWRNNDHWNSEVNENIKRKFLSWLKGLRYLSDVKISRWLGITTESNLSLHIFVDASQTAYSACIFTRCESSDGAVNVQLLQAKSRITPMKKITIPRLELMGATIGARLFDSVSQALKPEIENINSYFWTDSSTWSLCLHPLQRLFGLGQLQCSFVR
ncbi:uncharacterized protein TNCT_89691 [Trichonephila clavata]|uniref:Peptidase aspartic putative domain-containing protein n=1 Tax=Trichonephila clavata TaxID=2740835 RepID=A0A8X6GDI6_TRICU|nr:uncharacterized protein TNCT_89691 [Trichonephila clavata]